MVLTKKNRWFEFWIGFESIPPVFGDFHFQPDSPPTCPLRPVCTDHVMPKFSDSITTIFFIFLNQEIGSGNVNSSIHCLKIMFGLRDSQIPHLVIF